jgi:cytochrome c6
LHPQAMRATVLAVLLPAVLLAGCGSSSPAPKASSSRDGKQLFSTVGCSSCHALGDAGATGHVGPDLDALKPSVASVTLQVISGGGAMPSFEGTLSEPQIRAVAVYVARVAGR